MWSKWACKHFRRELLYWRRSLISAKQSDITMPYYIYKIVPGPTDLTKSLEKLEQYDAFKEAKGRAREMRAQMDKDADYMIKVMFADSELEAEEKLMEKREQPILREWEK